MMSMTIFVANIGTSVCSLPRPEVVRMVDSQGATLARFAADPVRLSPYLNLAPIPSAIPAPYSPEKAAYVWFIWNWRAGAEGACHTLEPPDVTFIMEFPGGIRLEAPAQVRFGPCSSEGGIADFGIVQN